MARIEHERHSSRSRRRERRRRLRWLSLALVAGAMISALLGWLLYWLASGQRHWR